MSDRGPGPGCGGERWVAWIAVAPTGKAELDDGRVSDEVHVVGVLTSAWWDSRRGERGMIERGLGHEQLTNVRPRYMEM